MCCSTKTWIVRLILKNQSKDKETKPAAAAATTNFTLKDVIIHGLKDEVEKVTKEELKDKESTDSN